MVHAEYEFASHMISSTSLSTGNFVATVLDTQRADVCIHVLKGVGCCKHTVSTDRIVELSESKSR